MPSSSSTVHSPSAHILDVQRVRPDTLICAGYKWLLGGYTLGLAYYSEKFDEGVPVEENWINRLDSHQFENLVKYQPLYKPQAGRYMMGEQSHFIGVPMLQAALNQLLDWGVDNVQNYCRDLAKKPIEQLRNLGCRVEEDAYRCNHLFGVRLSPKMNVKKLKQNLQVARVLVSHRGNAVRVAPNVYNTAADFDKLIACFEGC